MGLQRVGQDLVAKQQQGWDTDSKRRRRKKKHTSMRTRIEDPEELILLYSLQWKPTISLFTEIMVLPLKSKHIPELKIN